MSRATPLTTADYVRLAAFRRALREFLNLSEAAAGAVGLSGRHYQALLILRGRAPGEIVTINDLAQQLFLKHNSTVGLVDRLQGAALIERVPSSEDRRKVELRLTPEGQKVLEQLVHVHRAELKRIGPEMVKFFRGIVADKAPAGRPRAGAAGPKRRTG